MHTPTAHRACASMLGLRPHHASPMTATLLAAGLLLGAATTGLGQTRAKHLPESFHVDDEGKVHVDGTVYGSMREYVLSDYFLVNGCKCGTPPSVPVDVDDNGFSGRGGSTNDCRIGNTNPSAIYDPSVVKYRIPVVFHVIYRTDNTGFVSTARVQEQMDVLNEDFLALPATNGANGTDVQIEFYLATTDPNGQPTTGITYTQNNTFFDDSGSYWNTLAWDPDNYLNIYSNSGGGSLGYVPTVPAQGGVGSNSDRVVVLHSTVGRNAPIGPPFHLGRTVTHEVGHYLGLEHVFIGCGSSCYTQGDFICDTTPQSFSTSGCSSGNSCSSVDNIDNYMDYSDDSCMERFTPEQARRMRCTLEHYRSSLYEIAIPTPGNNDCADAETIACGQTLSGTTLGATTDTLASCASVAVTAPGVWYAYTGNGDDVTVATCGAATTYDSQVTVYSGTCASMTCVAANDDGCGGGTASEVNFSSVNGQAYLIHVHGFGAATGDFDVSVTCTPPPPPAGEIDLQLAQSVPMAGAPLTMFDTSNIVASGAAAPYSVELFLRAMITNDPTATGLTTFAGEFTDDGSGSFSAAPLLVYEATPGVPFVSGVTDGPTGQLGMFPPYRATIGANDADPGNGELVGGAWRVLPLSISQTGDGGVGAFAGVYKVTWTTSDVSERTVTLTVNAAGGGYQSSSGLVTTSTVNPSSVDVTFQSGCVCELDGDATQVDVFDLLVYLADWFPENPAADLDGIPGVDVFDLLFFLDCWFPASMGSC